MNKGLMWVLIILGVMGLALAGYVIYENISSPSSDWMMVKKPAVYLYPLEDSQISVKLDINGMIIKDVPEYNGGWDVFVTKESLIENQYDYLFYEAKLNKVDIPSEGWVVPYIQLNNWFEINLKKLGLNEKEKDQFKDYWLKEFPESNYYEIKILSEEFLDKNMDLIIEPKPDTEIRINFLFKPIEESYEIKNPQIITPTRRGFTVVEWGGILNLNYLPSSS
jgi:hypothetical protein